MQNHYYNNAFYRNKTNSNTGALLQAAAKKYLATIKLVRPDNSRVDLLALGAVTDHVEYPERIFVW